MVRCHGHVRLREPLGYWQLRLPHSQSLAIPCQSGNRLGRDCSPRLRKSISSRRAHGGWEPATVYEPLNVMVVATWSCHLTGRILRFHSLQGKNSAFTGIAHLQIEENPTAARDGHEITTKRYSSTRRRALLYFSHETAQYL
jgi:hypothetical protein